MPISLKASNRLNGIMYIIGTGYENILRGINPLIFYQHASVYARKEQHKMKKLITIALIVISLICGYMAGQTTPEPKVITVEHEVVDVITSDAGIQIVYEDGTGYWYEF